MGLAVSAAALDTKTLMKKTAKELQAELRKYALDTTGTKAVLVQRLQEHARTEKQAEEAEQANAHAVAAARTANDPPHTEAPASDASAAASTDEQQPALTAAPTDAIDSETVDAIDDIDATNASASVQPAHANAAVDSDARARATEQRASRAEQEPPAAAAASALVTLRIDNFRRPFTLNAVKNLVQEDGPFVEANGFWMNAIKTHCYVTYASADAATKTQVRLDGTVWPSVSGIALRAAVSEVTAMDVHAHGEPQTAATQKSSSSNRNSNSNKRSATEAFETLEMQRRQREPPTAASCHQTKTTPVLLYLPWTDEQVAQRKLLQHQHQQQQQQYKRGRRAADGASPRGNAKPRGRRGGGKKHKTRGGGGDSAYRQVRRQ